MFGWCLDGVWIRSESVLGCINTKSVGNNITSWYSDIASYSGALYCIQISMSGGVWMVSESVWMMSRLCLRVSEDASIQNLLAEIYIRP